MGRLSAAGTGICRQFVRSDKFPGDGAENHSGSDGRPLQCARYAAIRARMLMSLGKEKTQTKTKKKKKNRPWKAYEKYSW